MQLKIEIKLARYSTVQSICILRLNYLEVQQVTLQLKIEIKLARYSTVNLYIEIKLPRSTAGYIAVEG